MPVFTALRRRLGFGGELILAAFVLLLLAAALLLAPASYVHSNNIGACVNTNLVARQASNIEQLRSLSSLLGAQDKYIQNALHLTSRAAERAALARFGANTHRAYLAVQNSLHAAETHPFGRC